MPLFKVSPLEGVVREGSFAIKTPRYKDRVLGIFGRSLQRGTPVAFDKAANTCVPDDATFFTTERTDPACRCPPTPTPGPSGIR